MAEKLRRYNITDEQLHIFIKNSHGFVEDYAKLYLKIYIADCVADRIFNISSDDMKCLEIYTNCLYELISDIFTCASNLYLKSDDVDFYNYGSVNDVCQ